MEASEPFQYAFRQVTRTDTEGQQDSRDEESDKKIKLLNQLSIVLQNAMTWGKSSHLLNKVRKDI